MKALFFTLIFQFLFQFVSLNVFASEFCNSDSILVKSSFYKNDITLQSNLLSKNQVNDSEKLNAQSDTTKKEISNLDVNQSSKKPKKNRGKLFAVLTFLSGGLSIILLTIAVVMGMTHSAGTLLVLGIGFGLAFSALLLGYFAFKKLKKWSRENNQSPTFHYILASMGIYAALIPIGLALFVLILALISLAQGDLK